jgi:hypothetical protein
MPRVHKVRHPVQAGGNRLADRHGGRTRRACWDNATCHTPLMHRPRCDGINVPRRPIDRVRHARIAVQTGFGERVAWRALAASASSRCSYQPNTLGPAPEMLAPMRDDPAPPVSPREVRHQRCAARFHQHVLQTFAHQRCIAAPATGKHQRKVRELCATNSLSVIAGQRGARLARFQHHMRMHQRAMPFGGTAMRSSRSCVASTRPPSSIEPRLSPCGCRWPPLRHPARSRTAIRAAAAFQQRIRCDQRGHARCGRATHARTQRDALVQHQLETVLQAERLAQRHQRDAGRVLARIGRHFGDAPWIAAMRTTGSSMRRTSARSPAPATLWPSMSKPTPTLPTLAGEGAGDCGSWGGAWTWRVPAKGRSCACLQRFGDAQQIGEHAGGGHFRTGAGALHRQRIVAVTACT